MAVDFFVMSKCPDAQVCEVAFFPALFKISSIVNLTMNYIATETSPGQVCAHWHHSRQMGRGGVMQV